MKRVLSVAFALLAVSTAKSDAQTYPSRPITFIVPFAAGGPTDTIARVLSDRLRGSLGQTIIATTSFGVPFGTHNPCQTALPWEVMRVRGGRPYHALIV